MQIYPNGLRYPGGEPLAPTLDDLELATRLLAAQRHVEATHTVERRVRGARPPVSTDATDPRAAGWTFLVAEDEPQRDAIVALLRPLAELRGMKDPGAPLMFAPGADGSDWIMDT